MIEPELHLGPDIVVPDLAGWRRETLPQLPKTAWIETRPDWVCEVLSPSTARLDRGAKREIYAREGVGHLWLLDPVERYLEVFALSAGFWLLMATISDGDAVSAAPFEAISFPLSNLFGHTTTDETAGTDLMPINITMPALSPTMEEGNLAKWLVKEGDKVSSGDVIAEIETDKATMEVEAVDEGTIAKILVPAGTEGVKVNARDRDPGRRRREAPRCSQGQARSAPKAEAEGRSLHPPQSAEDRRSACTATLPRPAETPAGNGHAASDERVFASPLARRIAKDAGIDIAQVKGTGPHGRVVKADVESAVKSGGDESRRSQRLRNAAAPPRQAPAPMSDDADAETVRDRVRTNSCRMTTCARSSPAA